MRTKSAAIGSTGWHATAVLFSCLGCYVLSIFPTFAGANRLEARFIATSATYFVTLSGSDAGPGTATRPWQTINHAAELARAGDVVIVRGGRYVLSAQVRPRNSGRSDAWITYVGYPGEKAILDAKAVQRSSFAPGVLNEGVFQLEKVSHIRVANLTVVNSHDSGFTVRDSSDIELINNSTKGTFSSGIAVWDTNHVGHATERIRVIGNTITKATTWDQAQSEVPKQGEPPHEAISIGGAVDFEVAYNHVFDSDKEGIDIKETSSRGRVHHNLVDNIGRQGIYVDAWFGEIKDVEVFSNVIHDCRGAGIALSVEDGKSVDNVRIHHNLIFKNDGSGLYFSRWGADNPRENIRIFNNVFYRNGYGAPSAGQTYNWQTGGLYLYSVAVHDVSIHNNIFSENRGFQMGYSELFVRNGRSWQEAAREQKILIANNLIHGSNSIGSPIQSGGTTFDRVKIYAVNGDRPLFGEPLFTDSARQNFKPLKGSAALKSHIIAGAYRPNSAAPLWWAGDFPPKLISLIIDRPETGFRLMIANRPWLR
jgi:hypothetical protein